MKPLKLFTVLLAVFISAGTITAHRPVFTYTFVNPCQPFAIISPIPDTYGCFSYSATNAGANYSNGYFSWNFGDGNTTTGNYVYHCYPSTTVTVIYTVSVTYYSSPLCGPVPMTQTYSLTLNPPPQNLCVKGVLSTSLSASSVTVWSFPTIPETMFSYNYGDGTPSTGMDNTHTYANCGNYIIDVTFWDMNVPQAICHVYGAVNIACPTSTTMGIREKNAATAHIRVFPNPSAGTLHISSELQINGIKVADIAGREWILREQVNAGACSLDVSKLPAGVYFLELKLDNGSEINIKFIRD